jgi:hypothetical protein
MKHLLFDKYVDKSEEVIQNSKITQISDHAFEVVIDKKLHIVFHLTLECEHACKHTQCFL